MTTNDLNLDAWCAQRAENYRNYENAEMAMYPSDDHRDVALVEWTVRVLGNPLTAGSVDVLRVIAERHDLELNPAGTADQLTAANHRADGLANDLRSAQQANTAYANENDRLRSHLAHADEVIASLRAAIDEADEEVAA